MTVVVHGPTAAVEGWSRVSGARPVDGGAAVPGGVRHRPQSVRDYVPGARARSPMIGGRPLDGAAAAAGFADQSHLNRLFRGRVREDADRVVGPGAVQDVDGVHGRMVDHMGADAVLVRPDFVLYAPPSCSPARRPGTVARGRTRSVPNARATGSDPSRVIRSGCGASTRTGLPHPSQRGRRSRGSSAPIPMGRPTTHDRSAEREPCSPTGRSTGSTRSRGSRHGSSVVHSAPGTPHEGDDDTAGEASSSTTPRPCLGRSARGCADGAARPSRTGRANAPGP